MSLNLAVAHPPRLPRGPLPLHSAQRDWFGEALHDLQKKTLPKAEEHFAPAADYSGLPEGDHKPEAGCPSSGLPETCSFPNRRAILLLRHRQKPCSRPPPQKQRRVGSPETKGI